jgi:hypothetical protein
MVSVPAAKPSDVAVVTVAVAVAVLPDPRVTCFTVAIVVPPVVKVTGPVSVPAVVPETVAVSVRLAPNGNVVGLAVTAVVVAATPDATTVIGRVLLVDPVYVEFPEEKVARTLWDPEVGKSVLYVAVYGEAVERLTGVPATPSTINVTVPVGPVDPIVFGATVAVKVTDSLIASEVPGLAVSVVLVPVAATRAVHAVARLLASTDPIPVVKS